MQRSSSISGLKLMLQSWLDDDYSSMVFLVCDDDWVKPVMRTLIQGRELHDVIIPIGERGLTNSVVTTSRLPGTGRKVSRYHKQTLGHVDDVYAAGRSI